MAENQKPKPEQDDPEQSQRFIAMAKLLDSVDTGDSFKTAFSVISTTPSHSNPSKRGVVMADGATEK